MGAGGRTTVIDVDVALVGIVVVKGLEVGHRAYVLSGESTHVTTVGHTVELLVPESEVYQVNEGSVP